jgi:hypothetical protein
MFINKVQIKYLTYIFVIFLIITCLLILTNYAISIQEELIFPPTLVINLAHRSDRMKEISQEFANWPVKIERIDAVKASPGWKGCSASHLKCIKLAQERNYPWVFIIEDDCILTYSAIDQIHELLPTLWKNRHSWDIFYGGTTHVKNYTKLSDSPSIFKASGFTTHFCLIHKSTYNKIISGYPSQIPDFKEAIDVYYADNFRIWTTTPFFAKQRPGKSDIGQKDTDDHTGEFDKAENILNDII